MRVWVITLLTLMAALAGCTDGGDADGDTSGDDIDDQNDPIEGTGDDGDAGNTTGGPGADGDQDDEATANTPPTATLAASIEQGTIPFNVSFDLDGADADGDELSWTLDVDGDGTPETEGIALPANFSYTYDAEGLYNVSLVVSDGLNQSTASLVINATAAAAGEVGTTTQEATAEWLFGTVLVGCFGDLVGFGYPAELDGIAYGSFAIEPATYGKSYSVDIATAAEQDSPGFSFLDAERNLLAGGFLGDAGEGQVPKDAAFGVFWTCAGAAMTGTYSAG